MPARLRIIVITSAAAALGLAAPDTQAQGIPVIDAANLVQAVTQALNSVKEIKNQIEQIKQLQQQIESSTGLRGLGHAAHNPLLSNYLPPKAYTYINAVSNSGYSGLSSTGKSLRDKAMVYNCMDLTGSAQRDCQAKLAGPYQQKGLLQDAMTSSSARMAQITALMDRINATDDQKSVQEIQARIGAENAMLAHETSQVQLLQGMADSEERIARSREREQQYQMLARTGRIANYLP
ncbi:MAG: type IV secretion system protein [Paucibacter sp.]|nr:type IV secretion system protein [Roseateles sp.]